MRTAHHSTGGILADVGIGYALETQGRPVYDQDTSDIDGDLLAHELGHQWFGDSLTPARWSEDWSGTVADPGRDHIFDSLVYNRGAMALHALRMKIGDRAFMRMLTLWPTTNRHGTVSTQKFITFVERSTNRDLDAFFHAWLYQPGKPSL